MKTVSLVTLGLALACHLPTVLLAAPSAVGKIESKVRSAMASASRNQEISVIVHLKERPNLAPFRRLHRAERIRGVVKELRNKTGLSQRSLKSHLDLRRGQGRVGKFKSFWVFNGFSVTATPEVIKEIANRADVERIETDDVDIVPTAMPPEPNISVIRAPDIWSLGFYGQGVVVANLDSGVDNAHPDLASRWRGGTNSWYDPYAQHATPYDPTGHGTWTMGVMIGGDAGFTSIGVAPGAQWIAAKIFKDNGTATATGIHQAFQWILDPDGNPLTADAPHVVNNSWAYGSPGCNLAFQPDLQALVSAGIVPVFAAGNYGPGISSSVSPANYPEALAVGATNNLDQLYAGSSKGPSACGEASTIYPDIMAPGVNISTSDLYGLYASQSGTSLAAPHVAGGLAVLLSAYPDLTAAQQRSALLNSALDLGVVGPDNSFGNGRFDLAAAFDWVAQNITPTPTPVPTAVPTTEPTTAPTPEPTAPPTAVPTTSPTTIPTPPPVDTTGPDVSGLSVSPSPNNGSLAFSATVPAVRLIGDLADPVSNGLQSALSNAELFIDIEGVAGSGIPVLASDGVFDSPAEALIADIPLTTVNQLAEGTHVVYVHGQDAAGNWGSSSNVSLIIDKTSPVVSNVSMTLTNTTANVTATSVDPNAGSIQLAEWFDGVDPGVGLANPMVISGNTVSASINASGWSSGNHSVFVRARDGAGNWSAPVSSSVNVPPPNAIFADSFETGNFAAWKGGVSGTRVTVNTIAKMTATGTYGLQATLGSGTVPGFVTDTTPANEASYHARFYLNPHSANTSSGQVTIFSGMNAVNSSIFEVQYRKSGSSYQVRAVVLRSGGSTATSWFTITNNAAHAIEIAWQSGSAASFQLYTDGALKQTLSNLNTSANQLETVRLGPSAGLVSSATGSLYIDSFVSTRTTVIGP